MHNFLKSILALGAVAAVHATPITFTDIVNPSEDVVVSKSRSNSVYTFIHDINDNGFNSLTDAVTAADIYLRLADDELDFFGIGTEYVNIKLDNIMADSHMEVNTGTYHFMVDAAKLQDDGKLVVKLEATSGDFLFQDSRLEVKANRTGAIQPPRQETIPEAVPEPTTMALMLAGLIGMVAVVRRKKS
jgi:hypothetical protein